MKIVTVVGARPQFIKAGSVSRVFAQSPDVEEILVHTGQHFDMNMSDIFFTEMQIPKPKYFLGVGGKSHGAMTGQMIEKIEEILLEEKPDWVMVYGDTNSTLAGALAASKLHIKVAHVEAGLRSFNMRMPEEINRILTDQVSTILFCPTADAVNNLKQEGFGVGKRKHQVVNVGDVMQDGAIFYSKHAEPVDLDGIDNFILTTVHRAENTDCPDRLRGIINALGEISKDKTVVLPLHPRTKQKMAQFDIQMPSNIKILDPVGYLSMVWLIDNSDLVITDSGGLQKEAFFFEKNCITLRDETEWVELVDRKFNVLAGAEQDVILDLYNNFEFNKEFGIDLYGNGLASQRILEGLKGAS